ncbi:MAG: rod shape determining protein RodA [Solirubrobacterales bacterium]|jgi:rod shape determining protein RodA|nr:rod shape determining protein RodA [Solirubrobacterales bacterium]
MESQALPRQFTRRERAGAIERIGITRLDPALILGAIALLACSLYTLAVTTSADIPHNPYFYVLRQGIYGVVGLAFMLALARIDYSRFRELRVGLYTLMIASILLVFAAGTATRGSKRSITLPFFSLQTSELGKLLLVLALAAFAMDQGRRVGERRRTARILVMGLLPAMLVFAQPDLGTAAVYVAITFAILFVAGTRWTHFAFIGGLAAAAVTLILVVAPTVGHPILSAYQQDRLTSFLSPSSDPKDSSYQTHQSLIAIGSGGKTGRGSDATQTENGFLPERQTDFIFAAVGERFGFAGAAFVLSLYALLIWRALRIMTLAKNLYGSLIAGGIAAMLMFHVFVNVGITIGIMPVTGIPLPLMSFGGSSVVVTLMAIGLLQSVYVQARLSSNGRAPA